MYKKGKNKVIPSLKIKIAGLLKNKRAKILSILRVFPNRCAWCMLKMDESVYDFALPWRLHIC